MARDERLICDSVSLVEGGKGVRFALAAHPGEERGFAVRHGSLPSLWPEHTFGILLNKPALGLLRMADFGAVAYLVGALGARFPKALSWRPLAYLGRHSLAVVAMQSVAITLLLQFPLFETAFSRTLTAFTLLAAIYGGVAIKVRYFDTPALPIPVGARQPAARTLVGPDDARAA